MPHTHNDNFISIISFYSTCNGNTTAVPSGYTKTAYLAIAVVVTFIVTIILLTGVLLATICLYVKHKKTRSNRSERVENSNPVIGDELKRPP